MTPALSAAGAICDHVRDWLLGSRRGDWVSMGVASDGSYGVPPGLFFSFPVTCQHGSWQIVQVRACMLPCHHAHAWVLQQCFVSIDVCVEHYRVFVVCCFQGLEIDNGMREEMEGCIGQLEAERELIC